MHLGSAGSCSNTGRALCLQGLFLYSGIVAGLFLYSGIVANAKRVANE